MELWQERRFEIEQQVVAGMHVRRLGAEQPAGTLFHIHGLGESALCFERLMADACLRHWNHLAVDLIGYGKSFWNPQPLSLAEHAERLERLLDELAPRPVVVLGHSMGGVIGTLLGERAPEKVRAFINVEGNVSLADCGYSSQAAAHSPRSWLSAGYERLLDGLYRDQREAPTVLRPYCASIQMCDPRAFYRNAGELVELSGEEEMARRMSAIPRPKVFIFGAPRGSGDISRALLSEAGIEMIGIPDAGHWPFLDQHQAFVAEALDFLNRLATDAP